MEEGNVGKTTTWWLQGSVREWQVDTFYVVLPAPPSDDTPYGTRWPLGLGVHLSVTAAEPATEGTSVAAVAPAWAITTPPTYLHYCLRRLADGSRPPTPRGSLLACARGDVATPIRPITGRPSLSPRSFTRSPIGWSCDLPTPRGGLRAYHVPRVEQGWFRPCLYAGGAMSACAQFGRTHLDHVPFGPSLSASLACSR